MPWRAFDTMSKNMKLSGNTILVTGGSNGIGLALAKRFADRDNEVIICGRNEEKLRSAKDQVPQLQIKACDVGSEDDRVELAEWANIEFPKLNVLVNNAGIQRRIDLTASEDWKETSSEIAINLEAPIHLSRLLFPQLSSQSSSAILNVTSGLSFVPLVNVPVYCATKAALHSFTLSLRYQLKGSDVEVIEIIPPAVDTDLGGTGLHTFGVNVDEFADAVFEGLERGDDEIAYGTALTSSQASREDLNGIFQGMNKAFSR
jgi:uncharacterized oxidoreductase